MQISSLAGLYIRFIFVGGKSNVSTTMLQALEKHEARDKGLDEKWPKFFALRLALLYLRGLFCTL
ncbi:hypothetical protein P691DRAFT_801775 [Macrolepiota fuliginosa MF-IS2]|uniref:Uncharacterized protein n=1 Tax=Macrolepiota fuliginosa MF-IS2 TaxID=1400762 RepID=A0A9P6C0X3_9AGAR|nr:hypothetical protein P691DRAFT_801775 [Macrolepiota fuliginosa MF-IS2]